MKDKSKSRKINKFNNVTILSIINTDLKKKVSFNTIKDTIYGITNKRNFEVRKRAIFQPERKEEIVARNKKDGGEASVENLPVFAANETSLG